MRKIACCLVMILLGAGVLMAPPAFAAFAAIVQLPASTVYSPYGGPATVTFTFAPDDASAIFTVRIRQPGHGAIKEKNYLVGPSVHPSPQTITFSWGGLSASAPTDYVVDVRRQDSGAVITSETFTVLPKLVSELSAQPSPFYPLVQDGYKDHTTIGFSLAADTVDTVVHVFDDDAYGRCCGTEIRTENLGPLAAGTHGWIWDGTAGDASAAPKGTYFARVEATDAAAVSMVSQAQKVEITKGLIRKTATKQKNGSAYARAADERETRRGGDCLVSRNAASHEADILCANAEISIYWRWGLKAGERIESVSFVIDGGSYGCHRTLGHTTTTSSLRVHSPPTSTCAVISARIKYSYPVQA
jgi:FlgD Ig-like domain